MSYHNFSFRRMMIFLALRKKTMATDQTRLRKVATDRKMNQNQRKT